MEIEERTRTERILTTAAAEVQGKKGRTFGEVATVESEQANQKGEAFPPREREGEQAADKIRAVTSIEVEEKCQEIHYKGRYQW